MLHAIEQLRMNDIIGLTDNISEADAFLALNSRLKRNSRIQSVAKSHDIPIYVTKTSSSLQIIKTIRAFMSEHANGFKDYGDKDNIRSSEKTDALEEARLAIEHIVIPRGEPVELLPRSASIIYLQMELVKKYHLQSQKVGKEPNVRLHILPLHAAGKDEGITQGDEMFETLSSTNDLNVSHTSLTRLQLLPD